MKAIIEIFGYLLSAFLVVGSVYLAFLASAWISAKNFSKVVGFLLSAVTITVIFGGGVAFAYFLGSMFID